MKGSKKHGKINNKLLIQNNNIVTIVSFSHPNINQKKSEESEINVVFIEYYQPIFIGLLHKYHNEIEKALIFEPELYAKTFWKYIDPNKHYSGHNIWKQFFDYLSDIEKQFKNILNSHSLYFWIHLYRRIGVSLSNNHRGKTDPNTIGLVRQIMEAAFTKYSNLNKNDDLKLSSTVEPKDILGGLFEGAWIDIFEEDRESYTKFYNRLKVSNQWVITEFTIEDFINIHRLEGFAYEYWWATAKMRSIGKSVIIRYDDKYILKEVENDTLDFLIHHYDSRIKSTRFSYSTIGVGFYDKGINPFTALFPIYNIFREKLKDIIPSIDIIPPSDFISNFIFGVIDLKSYLDAHSFVEESVFADKNFHLRNLVAVLAAISNSWFLNIISSDGYVQYTALINKYQRAYETISDSIDEYLDNLIAIMKVKGIFNELDEEELINEKSFISEYLLLNSQKQSNTSLWTGGPRYIFLSYSDCLIIDLEPASKILVNIFYKVIYDQQAKGTLFEDNFRSALSKSHNDLLNNRILKNKSNEKKEVDALIRVNNTLIICECRAMERPLDFEIGRIKTIQYRNLDLDDKVDQVLGVESFIKDNPVGVNYNFSWANDIISIVVSPFIEWIWTVDKKLWIDDKTPRILSFDEVLKLLGDIRKRNGKIST